MKKSLLTAVFALLASVARAQEPIAPAATPLPPIVLITLSSVRADHLGAYGYAGATSPALDEFARTAVVFEHAYSPMASTLPAHLSLLTGALPKRHGVVDPQAMQKLAWQPTKELASAAMLLGGAGWRTAAFVSARATSRASGLDAGFQSFDEPGQFEVRENRESTRRASAWLAEHASESFFLWVHYRGALPPSQPPAECRVALAVDESFAALLESRAIEPARFDLGVSKQALARAFFPERSLGQITEKTQFPAIEAAHFAALYERYDGDLRCLDRELGALLAKLPERAIVVVAGDHGLSLGEHTQLEAGDVQREQLHVPLFIRFPTALGVAPSRIARPVSLVDALPTVLARFENPARAAFLAQGDGRDALDAAQARTGVLGQRLVRAKAQNDPGPVWSWTTERWHYVHRPELSDKLFDLAADPHTSNDVLAANAELARELKSALLAELAPPAKER